MSQICWHLNSFYGTPSICCTFHCHLSWSQCLSWHSNQPPLSWANPIPCNLFKLQPFTRNTPPTSANCATNWKPPANLSDASNLICHWYPLDLTPSHGRIKWLLSNTITCPGCFAPGEKGTAQSHNGCSDLASVGWIIKHNLEKAKRVWDTFLTSKKNDFSMHNKFHNNRKQSSAHWASMVTANTNASATANLLLLTLWLDVPWLQLLIIILSPLKILPRYGVSFGWCFWCGFFHQKL